ncbi:MAG: hypothetical protein ACOX3U_00190 [Christensenellales bacterium]|jgi:hypothetical protein
MKLIPTFNTINGNLDSMTIDADPGHMNFVASKAGFGIPYGTFYTETIEKKDNGIEATYQLYADKVTLKVFRRTTADNYIETYTFINNNKERIEIQSDKLGIYAPFNDNYDILEVTLNRRCHAHIWCGGNCAYIYGLRMNGGDGNVGLVLTKGYIDSYGIERKNNSNDRGDIILYLPAVSLEPEESLVVEWEMFAFKDVRDFFNKASEYDTFINLQTRKFSMALYETVTVTADRFIDSANISGEEIPVANTKAGAKIILSNKSVGEKKIEFSYGEHKSFAYINVYDDILSVIDRRINFIIDNQQIKDENSPYYGAYALYDNEEDEPFIVPGRFSDKNACRERSAMTAVMLARLLKGVKDNNYKSKIHDSLMLSMDFIERQIVRPDGVVCDDAGYKKNPLIFHRKYNYAWYINIYAMMYEYTGDIKWLDKTMLMLGRYYSINGAAFFSIGMPIMRITALTERDNLNDYRSAAIAFFLMHGDKIIELQDKIPPHEVKYEQSIVAPAATILMSCYNISGDRKYLNAADTYMKYLAAFNGYQPDYRLRDIPIRHWDGYYFGKAKMFGDTFPHHWSCLTAEAFSLYGNIVSDKSFSERCDSILRNNLCLFDEEGRGSAAYIYPKYINGRKGGFFDPYANDQDWAIYYALEYSSEI